MMKLLQTVLACGQDLRLQLHYCQVPAGRSCHFPRSTPCGKKSSPEQRLNISARGLHAAAFWLLFLLIPLKLGPNTENSDICLRTPCPSCDGSWDSSRDFHKQSWPTAPPNQFSTTKLRIHPLVQVFRGSLELPFQVFHWDRLDDFVFEHGLALLLPDRPRGQGPAAGAQALNSQARSKLQFDLQSAFSFFMFSSFISLAFRVKTRLDMRRSFGYLDLRLFASASCQVNQHLQLKRLAPWFATHAAARSTSNQKEYTMIQTRTSPHLAYLNIYSTVIRLSWTKQVKEVFWCWSIFFQAAAYQRSEAPSFVPDSERQLAESKLNPFGCRIYRPRESEREASLFLAPPPPLPPFFRVTFLLRFKHLYRDIWQQAKCPPQILRMSQNLKKWNSYNCIQVTL